MKHPPRQRLGRHSLDVIEDGVHLLREAPLGVHLAYHVGTAPFVLALLWFWSDMTRGAFADVRCAPAALGLAALYLWMKAWQSVFAARLTAALRLGPELPWTPGRWLRLLSTQAALQPWGLIVFPLSAVPLGIPIPWAFSVIQSATVEADAAGGSAQDCLRRAFRNGMRWPGQNNGIFGLLLLVTFGVILNLGIGLASLPYLARTLFGFDNEFTLSSGTIFNTTFLLGVLALSYLVVDPLVKAIYVLRCFEGAAVSTGDDLRAGLKRMRAARRAVLAAVFVLAAAWIPSPILAAETPLANPVTLVRPPELDRALRQVLERADYTWRSPREQSPEESDPPGQSRLLSWLKRQGRAVAAVLDRNAARFFSLLDRCLRALFNPPKAPPLPTGHDLVDWMTGLRILVILVLLAAIGWIGWLGYRLWTLRRPKTPAEEPVATPVALPDLTLEHVSADQLPEDGWLALARDLAGRGDLRLALRAVYLASLAHLARREFIRLASYKTNRDYQRELARRSRDIPAVAPGFDATAADFDRVWYGAHPVSPELVTEAEVRLEVIRQTRVA